MGHDKPVLQCFICKEGIPENSSFSDVALLDLPNGEKGYVHRRHSGVDQEDSQNGK